MGELSAMHDDQIVAGAHDAANELGYRIVEWSLRQEEEDPMYRFVFEAHGLDAIVEFFASESDVRRSGLSAREYACEETLAGLREPRA
jgi:hypothetical protein